MINNKNCFSALLSFLIFLWGRYPTNTVLLFTLLLISDPVILVTSDIDGFFVAGHALAITGCCQ